jgi:hypothetical protein
MFFQNEQILLHFGKKTQKISLFFFSKKKIGFCLKRKRFHVLAFMVWAFKNKVFIFFHSQTNIFGN